MSRVSENSNRAAIDHALNRTKARMEDLQLKGSTLKQITRPSDNPVSNVEALTISSTMTDNGQFLRNADFALMNLNITEKSIEQLSEILNKAKEIAIGQSSDFYDGEVRKNIANEVHQLRNQALAIANTRIGQRYLFSGFKTLTKPFNESGDYAGDKGKTSLEVSKDFFVPVNFHGEEVFYYTQDTSAKQVDPLGPTKNPNELPPKAPAIDGRDLASKGEEAQFSGRDNIFSDLEALSTALENNDAPLVRSLLEKFDSSVSRLITLRTRLGSLSNSVMNSKNSLESNNIDHASRKSQLVDADAAELFSDITKNQNVLRTSYQATQGMLNQTLLDFLK
jgi:flagellar hook-associated protein 3 FlgL